MRKVFTDHTKEEELVREGCVVVQSLFDPETIKKCWHLFTYTDGLYSTERYNTLDVDNNNIRETVYEELHKIIGEKIKSLLDDYKFIGFNFAIKKAHGSAFHPHLDDMHVESGKRGINVWIPLVDVKPENGALYIVKKSHLFPIPIRGMGMPFPFKGLERLIDKHATFFSLKVGDALFFDDRVIHGSQANQTSEDRPAIITGLIPKESNPIIYLRHDEQPENSVEMFEAPPELFNHLVVGKRPVGFKSLGYFEYQPTNISEEEFLNIVK